MSFSSKPAAIFMAAILLVAVEGAHSSSLHDIDYDSLFSMPIVGRKEPYTCPNMTDHTKKLNDYHLRGTNLGGWLVLEPWITPSLFYQFLGATKKWGDDAQNRVAIDSRTFCLALGKEEANRQLRRHWKTWVNEEQIANLAKIEVQSVRIPVGDWMFQPYEPYIGCWDGALEELDRAIALCDKHNITVLIDVHTAIGGQNGFDNGGDTSHYEWYRDEKTGNLMYKHWPIRGGDWVGRYNTTSQQYETINHENIVHSIKVVDAIIDRYVANPAVIAVEPLNEPWAPIPLDILKEFYWRCYQLVQLKAPHWITLLHDSFRLSPENWGGFLANCDHYGIDTHIYQAWMRDFPPEVFEDSACINGLKVQSMERIGVPTVVGEWSLATDNCAMWLNGFQDNLPGYPMVECDLVECPAPYMGPDQPGAPPDPRLPAQDPFGASGPSSPVYGMCVRQPPFPDERKVRDLALDKLHSLNSGHGNFFWNFRTEFEPRWDYQQAVALGWIPANWYNQLLTRTLRTACDDPEHHDLAPLIGTVLKPSSTSKGNVVVDGSTVVVSVDADNVGSIHPLVWIFFIALHIGAVVLLYRRFFGRKDSRSTYSDTDADAASSRSSWFWNSYNPLAAANESESLNYASTPYLAAFDGALVDSEDESVTNGAASRRSPDTGAAAGAAAGRVSSYHTGYTYKFNGSSATQYGSS